MPNPDIQVSLHLLPHLLLQVLQGGYLIVAAVGVKDRKADASEGPKLIQDAVEGVIQATVQYNLGGRLLTAKFLVEEVKIILKQDV